MNRRRKRGALQGMCKKAPYLGMWLHGPSSRTISAVPGSTCYSFQGQNQQPSGFRQSQQPSQNYGALGYPNFYHSQSGISLEHQQQNSRDGPLVGSQGQPPKQSQQIWQNSYYATTSSLSGFSGLCKEFEKWPIKAIWAQCKFYSVRTRT
ncbi:unnamed protein product [Thlaspi arvense]|uniref:Uncharacterized protein n=1 Tax=Thlaspi arvense TaxID=13288 RepID=A0AAU9RIN2_THLAR|nr:unnamed protein product [Thlaspi arvense]